jgi:uncharacterized sulfatase
MIPGRARAVTRANRALWALVVVLVAGISPACGGRQRPDVILILSDDLSYRIGLYGFPVQTPSLDALAGRGRRFDRAYCQFPLCNPSRTSLLTGWRPERTAVWGNLRNPAPYVRDAVPLQEHFERNGYFTARVGKIYHSRFEDEFRWSHVYNTYGGEEIVGRPKRWGPSRRPEEELPDARAAQRVIELLSTPREQPLFIAMGLIKPHDPWVVPRPYFRLYPPESMELPPSASEPYPKRSLGGLGRERWPEALAAYRAAVTFADAQVGRVLEAVDRLHRWDRTVVVFAGDNGFHAGEHGRFGKNTLYEEASRVPLVIATAAVKEPGTATRRVVELVDVYPTLVDLCGLPPVPGLDGVSLRPLLEDPTARVKEAAFTMTKVGATRHGAIGLSTRTERYRYTVWPLGREELYDHETDPDEMVNLADRPELRETIERLRGLAAALPRIRADRVRPAEAREGPTDGS